MIFGEVVKVPPPATAAFPIAVVAIASMNPVTSDDSNSNHDAGKSHVCNDAQGREEADVRETACEQDTYDGIEHGGCRKAEDCAVVGIIVAVCDKLHNIGPVSGVGHFVGIGARKRLTQANEPVMKVAIMKARPYTSIFTRRRKPPAMAMVKYWI